MKNFFKLMLLSASLAFLPIISHSVQAKNVIVLGDECGGNNCCNTCNCSNKCSNRNVSLEKCRSYNACDSYRGMFLEDDAACEDYCNNLFRNDKSRKTGCSLEYCKQVVLEEERRKALEKEFRLAAEKKIRKEVEEQVRRELELKIRKEIEAAAAAKLAPTSEPIR